MYNSLPLRFLIIISLLLTQLGGMTHSISHVLPEQLEALSLSPSDKHVHQHDKHCGLCDAYAQIANGIGSGVVNIVLAQNFTEIEQNHTYSFTFVALRMFAARAPPAFS